MLYGAWYLLECYIAECLDDCESIDSPIGETDHKTYPTKCSLNEEACQTRNANLAIAYYCIYG